MVFGDCVFKGLCCLIAGNSLSHLPSQCTHIFVEERDFHFKIRKVWKAQFGPLSHPLFTLLKGGTTDLIDASREDEIPGITSYIPVGRGARP